MAKGTHPQLHNGYLHLVTEWKIFSVLPWGWYFPTFLSTLLLPLPNSASKHSQIVFLLPFTVNMTFWHSLNSFAFFLFFVSHHPSNMSKTMHQSGSSSPVCGELSLGGNSSMGGTSSRNSAFLSTGGQSGSSRPMIVAKPKPMLNVEHYSRDPCKFAFKTLLAPSFTRIRNYPILDDLSIFRRYAEIVNSSARLFPFLKTWHHLCQTLCNNVCALDQW